MAKIYQQPIATDTSMDLKNCVVCERVYFSLKKKEVLSFFDNMDESRGHVCSVK